MAWLGIYQKLERFLIKSFVYICKGLVLVHRHFLKPRNVMPNFRTARMTTNIWIEKGWGDSVENATFDDIKSAIEETIRMDEEHGAFWVGHMENEFVLEVHKNLDLFFVYGENQDEQIQTKLDNWEDVKHFFKLYFDKEFEKLKTEIELRPFTYKKLTNG